MRFIPDGEGSDFFLIVLWGAFIGFLGWGLSVLLNIHIIFGLLLSIGLNAIGFYIASLWIAYMEDQMILEDKFAPKAIIKQLKEKGFTFNEEEEK